MALAVHITVGGGETQAAKHEAGCTRKGQDKDKELGKRRMKSQQRFRGGGGERKNEHKSPRRTSPNKEYTRETDKEQE